MLGRPGGHRYEPVPLARNEPTGVGGVREIELLQHSGPWIEQLETLHRLTSDRAGDATVRQERVRRNTEDPLWERELGLLLAQRHDLAALLGVQVPPAVRVVDEMEDALRAPQRLSHGLAIRARDVALVRERAVVRQVGHAQLGALEREQRVVPARPRKLPTVRADARRRVEVAPARDWAGLLRAVRRERDELVHRLAVHVMALAHADDQATVRRDAAVGIATRVRRRRLRRYQLRLGSGPIEAIHAAVVEVRAPDRVAVTPVGAAAVLVHA